MDIQHANAKIFFDRPLELDGGRMIGLFHDWVREQVFDEVLVDVADYRHVPDGPSLMIVGHEADYVIDHADGRPGLLYNRKASLEGSNVDLLRQAVTAAAGAARLLVETLGADAPVFSQTDLQLSINDRAIAPNTAETFAALTPDLAASATAILGHSEFTLTHLDDPRRLFATLVTAKKPFDLAALG